MTDYINKQNYGFFRTSIATPEVAIGDVFRNNVNIIKLFLENHKKNSSNLILFPELCLTGYTCEDLFFQDYLYEDIKKAIPHILKHSRRVSSVIVIGLPFKLDHSIYNVAMVINHGKILGIVPKQNLPNNGEFREKRWFDTFDSDEVLSVDYLDQNVPFGNNLIFKEQETGMKFGIEICEDLFVMNPPSNQLVQNGCDIVLNLSASNALVSKQEFRRQLVQNQSAKGYIAYLYASSTISESSTDLLFSGHSMIVEGGNILEETIYDENVLLTADIDILSLRKRRHETSINFNSSLRNKEISFKFNNSSSKNKLMRTIDPYPFIPSSFTEDKDYAEILKIQSLALANRFKKTGIPKALIGISGGLDSTWALLVTIEAFKYLDRPLTDIIGVTMPGFATSSKTYGNAIQLMREFGITIKDIDITESCEAHLSAINHSKDSYDVTFENVQARERTAVLMNLSNKYHGLVVGTGNLSELALGWCTYNGDHMSMYAINAGLPKTLIKKLINFYRNNNVINADTIYTLDSILETPISPELIPSKSGDIEQKTEDVLGKYDIHDFILYHFLRNGSSPKKIKFLLPLAFPELEEDEINDYIKTFFNRFMTQQFKRSALPDSVKIGTISLSPRNDFRMPSDAALLDLEFLENN